MVDVSTLIELIAEDIYAIEPTKESKRWNALEQLARVRGRVEQLELENLRLHKLLEERINQ